MRTERFVNVTDAAFLCTKLYRLEVVDIGLVEEEISDSCRLLVHFVRMSSQNDAFRDNAGGICTEQCTSRDQIDDSAFFIRLSEYDSGYVGTESDWQVR